MKKSTNKICPSAPLKPITIFEETLRSKMNDINHRIKIFVNKSKERIFSFKMKKIRGENFRELSTLSKSCDTFPFATTPTFVALSVTGISLIVIPKSTGIACVMSIGRTVIYGLPL